MLDAVQQGLALPSEALRHSRGVLRDFGNMSSATLMFVLQRILRDPCTPVTAWPWRSALGSTVESFAFLPCLIGRFQDCAAAAMRAERMDTDCVDFADYQRCLADLARVNLVTLTHRPVLAFPGA